MTHGKVIYVAKKIAEVHGISVEQVANQTYANTVRLFDGIKLD